jgi:TetR/AcrR family transcriptional regulator, transcriptional repressor for nem operon
VSCQFTVGRNYAEYFEGLLAEGLDPETCLSRYIDVFADTLRNENRMCLAGILSAERNELPDDVRTEVVK